MNKTDLKNELLVQVEELANKAKNDEELVLSDINRIKKQWRKTLSEEESFLDKELNDKYDALMALVDSKSGQLLGNAEEAKKQIIEKAKAVLNEKNYKKAQTEMNELMDEWKNSGHIAKERADELWAEFKEVRDSFYAAKKEYYNNLTETFAKAKETKLQLIEDAKAANEMENIKELTNKMNELMEAWKQAGSAGRATDNELWEQFKAERKAFFKKRDVYFAGLKEVYAARVEQKKEIIAEAKKYLARGEFTGEEIGAVKDLQAKWKEIGNAGKNNENDLWTEFKGVLDKYYDNMRYYKQK